MAQNAYSPTNRNKELIARTVLGNDWASLRQILGSINAEVNVN